MEKDLGLKTGHDSKDRTPYPDPPNCLEKETEKKSPQDINQRTTSRPEVAAANIHPEISKKISVLRSKISNFSGTNRDSIEYLEMELRELDAVAGKRTTVEAQ